MAELSQADQEKLVRQIVSALAAPGTGTPMPAAAARPSWRIIIIIVIEFLRVIERHLGDDGTLAQ
jgi:hypothetical protein